MRYLGLVFVVACGAEGGAPVSAVTANTVDFGIERVTCDDAATIGVEVPQGSVFTAMICVDGQCGSTTWTYDGGRVTASCSHQWDLVVNWTAPATLID